MLNSVPWALQMGILCAAVFLEQLKAFTTGGMQVRHASWPSISFFLFRDTPVRHKNAVGTSGLERAADFWSRLTGNVRVKVLGWWSGRRFRAEP